MSEAERYSPENYAIIQLSKYSVPVSLGIATGFGVGVVEHAMGADHDISAHRAIDDEIWKLQTHNHQLEEAEQLLNDTGITVNGVDVAIANNNQQISELQAQDKQIGSEALANFEFFTLPVVLGAAVAVVGLKRAIQKEKRTRSEN